MEYHVTTLDIRPVDRAPTGSIPATLVADLTDLGVDLIDPAAVRAAVEGLLAALLAEDTLTDRRRVCDLRDVLVSLYTDGERAANDALAADIAAFLDRRRSS